MNDKFYIALIDKSPRLIECEKWVEYNFVRKLLFGLPSSNYIETVYCRFKNPDDVIICDDTGFLTQKPVYLVTQLGEKIHGACLLCGIDWIDECDRDICGVSEARIKAMLEQVYVKNPKLLTLELNQK